MTGYGVKRMPDDVLVLGPSLPKSVAERTAKELNATALLRGAGNTYEVTPE